MSFTLPHHASLLLVAVATACRGGDPRPAADSHGGTLVISAPADADVLLPPLTLNITSAEVDGQIFERLAEPGASLNTIGDAGWTGRLARGWTWSADSLSIAFTLDSAARWHDGTPVRAGDVRFTYQLYTDPAVSSPLRPLLANIDSVTTRDSLTAVVWFHQRAPEQFYNAAYVMYILPAHLLAAAPRDHLASSSFARDPVGSGPYHFVRWVPRQSIELAADTVYHHGRPNLDRLIWSIAPDPNAAITRVMTGEADMVEFLRPPDLAEITKHADLKAVRYPSLGMSLLLFNERDPRHAGKPHPIFSDRTVRRALAMSVDRARLVKSVFDTLAWVAVGPVTHALPTYDSTIAQLPFAPDSARRLLDADGWRARGDSGWRSKNGQPLRFSILVPASSTPRLRMAVLLQEMFRAVGARVDLEQTDFPTYVQRQESRQFDASMVAVQLDPTPSSIRQSWSSAAARARDGGNFGSYENPAFDALVDSAVTQTRPDAAHALYRKAYAILIADAPAIWLFEPMNFAGMQRRIHPKGMRADAWWAQLDQWSIPVAERTARDRVALARNKP